MAVAQKIVPLHALSEDQALAWLQSQGTVTISSCELGRQWNWHRNTVGRKLQSWAATGAIKRKGKTICAVQKQPSKAAQTALVQPAQTAGSAPSTRDRRSFSKFMAFLMFLAALCLIGALGYINYMSWSALSDSTPSLVAFRVTSVVIDALAIILPAAAKIARWRNALLLWAMWAVCFIAVLWLALGFAFGNFGEVVESRRATIDRKDIIEDRLKGLRVKLADADRLRRQCESDGPCALAKDRKTRVIEVARLTVLAAGFKSDIEKYEGIRENLPPIVVADPQNAGGVNAIKRIVGYTIDLADARTGFDVTLSLMLVLLPSGLIRGAISLVRD